MRITIDSTNFQVITFRYACQIFLGNSDVTSREVGRLNQPVTARYIRFHPLGAQNEDGPLLRATPRVTVLTCQEGRNGTR